MTDETIHLGLRFSPPCEQGRTRVRAALGTTGSYSHGWEPDIRECTGGWALVLTLVSGGRLLLPYSSSQRPELGTGGTV